MKRNNFFGVLCLLVFLLLQGCQYLDTDGVATNDGFATDGGTWFSDSRFGDLGTQDKQCFGTHWCRPYSRLRIDVPN